jgi:glutathione S-transferase
VLAVAKYASVHVATEVQPAQELHGQPVAANSPSPKSLVLSIGSDVHITMSNSMIRTIASIAPASELLGRNDFEAAQVDSWLSFLWHSVELPLHVLNDLESLPNSGEKAETEVEGVKSQLKSAIATVEGHLTKKQQQSLPPNSYIVGVSITLADICLAVALRYSGSDLMLLSDPDSTIGRWFAEIENECHLDNLT